MTKRFFAAKDVAALVPMPELLDTLGIQIDTRSRRAPSPGETMASCASKRE